MRSPAADGTTTRTVRSATSAPGRPRKWGSTPFSWSGRTRRTSACEQPKRIGDLVSWLFAPLGQPALPRAVVVVVLRIDLPHRRLARALFVRVRDEPRQPGDEEDRVAQLVGEAEIGADGRDRAVDVHRQRP